MNEFAVKKKTLEKLKEESGTVRQYAAFVFYLCALLSVGSAFCLVTGILFQSAFYDTLHRSSEPGFFSRLIFLMVSFCTDNQPLNGQGQFNLVVFVSNLAETAISAGMISYTAFCINRIFCSIEQGETPFTVQNISYWKKCSRFFSAIAVLLFLLSFLLWGALLPAVIPPLLASCFFYSMSLVFEYGSCLQTESDETL